MYQSPTLKFNSFSIAIVNCKYSILGEFLKNIRLFDFDLDILKSGLNRIFLMTQGSRRDATGRDELQRERRRDGTSVARP